MEYDEEKVDQEALALLWLTTFKQKQFGQVVHRAWKGHDWDALNRLHAKGFIGDPLGKAKSVWLQTKAQSGSLDFSSHFLPASTVAECDRLLPFCTLLDERFERPKDPRQRDQPWSN
jgi:hypothetical protein